LKKNEGNKELKITKPKLNQRYCLKSK